MLVGRPLAKRCVEANCSRKSTCFRLRRGTVVVRVTAASLAATRSIGGFLVYCAKATTCGNSNRDVTSAILRCREGFHGCICISLSRRARWSRSSAADRLRGLADGRTSCHRCAPLYSVCSTSTRNCLGVPILSRRAAYEQSLCSTRPAAGPLLLADLVRPSTAGLCRRSRHILEGRDRPERDNCRCHAAGFAFVKFGLRKGESQKGRDAQRD